MYLGFSIFYSLLLAMAKLVTTNSDANFDGSQCVKFDFRKCISRTVTILMAYRISTTGLGLHGNTINVLDYTLFLTYNQQD
uniref:Secreted protein n=1 Tax=Pararge aegeria TaxID=116150 RepID=S4NJI1_9NEOP